MVEIALQNESKGVVYEGYRKAFRQCIFEEGNVEGRNERYEFRCDYDLQCCGRTCCIPEDATIPLWLMIIGLVLLLLTILAILGLLAWLWSKRKPKPKKDYSGASRDGYTALTTEKHSVNGSQADRYRDQLVNRLESDPYSSTDHYARDTRDYGYGNRGYGGRGYDEREIAIRRDYGPPLPPIGRSGSRVSVSSDGGSMVRHGIHETVEETFKQEITYERPASTDSREML